MSSRKIEKKENNQKNKNDNIYNVMDLKNKRKINLFDEIQCDKKLKNKKNLYRISQ